MAGNSYSHTVAGVLTEVAAIQASTGAVDAGKIIALNAAGLLDSSFISGLHGGVPGGTPGGSVDAVFSAPVTADLAVGEPAYITSAGLLAPAQADAIGNIARGIVTVAGTLTPAANATITFEGIVTGPGISGLTPGVDVYLDAAASKKFTTTAPTAAGTVVQPLGFALSATSFYFERQRPNVN